VFVKIEYRKWDNLDRPFAGKIILRPETPEEQAGMEDFRQHIGSPQRGRKFEIIFKRRTINAQQVAEVLRRHMDGQPAAEPVGESA
jgi:hypothetical protein